MKKILRKLNVILDKRQKSRMKLLVVMMVIGALLETVSNSLVLPIATVLTNPQSVNQNGLVGSLYRLLGCDSVQDFALLMLIGLLLALACILSMSISATAAEVNCDAIYCFSSSDFSTKLSPWISANAFA